MSLLDRVAVLNAKKTKLNGATDFLSCNLIESGLKEIDLDLKKVHDLLNIIQKI